VGLVEELLQQLQLRGEVVVERRHETPARLAMSRIDEPS
jgi:hypothetical protein